MMRELLGQPIFFGCGIILAIQGIFWISRMMPFFPIVGPSSFQFSSQATRYSHPRTGLVTIATNGYDASFLVKTAISHGNFDGPIYVIADKEAPEGSKTVRVGTPEDALLAVDMKARVFSIIEDYMQTKDIQHSIPQRLLYVDADVGVNSPIDDNFLSFIDWQDNSQCDVYMLRERWYTQSTWNTGTMLLDRDHSAAFLTSWHRLIQDNHDIIMDQHQYAKDQWALMKLLEEGVFNVCPLPDQVSFVADFYTRHFRGTDHTTFTHWTSAKRLSHHNFKRGIEEASSKEVEEKVDIQKKRSSFRGAKKIASYGFSPFTLLAWLQNEE
jgi:hypothetical protein